jgi:hypothetical protein
VFFNNKKYLYYTFFLMIKNIGVGTPIAAAYIGLGTVTLCTLAGVNFGFNLLWAM